VSPSKIRRYIAGLSRRVTHSNLAARFIGELPAVQVEYFSEASIAHDEASAIPRVVYQTWENNLLGKTHAKLWTHFRSLNPEFSFRLFTTSDCDKWMEDNFGQHPIVTIYRNAKFGPMKADIWRYCVLYKQGGVYCDISKMISCPLNRFVGKSSVAVISYELNAIPTSMRSACVAPRISYPSNLILNWCLASSRGHPFLGRCIENIVKAYPKFKNQRFEFAKDAVLRFTGPEMMTLSIHQSLLDDPEIGFEQAGIDFGGYGISEIPRSWTRYLTSASYRDVRNSVIVE
jgi:mannosyltransferase OCH1-like enzyme